jgi:hypothetical protein
LVRIKPASRYLTSFYLMIAGGGALGGIFVTLIAPLIFPAFWEFQLAILGCGLMAALILYRDRHSWFHHGSRWLPFLLVLGMAAAIEFAAPRIPGLGTWLPAKIYSRVFFGILAMAAIWKGWKCPILGNCTRWIQSFALGLLVFLGYVCVGQAQFQVRNSSLRFRSFFGAFRIEQNGTSHALKHGQTMHGWQIRDGDHDPTPTSYYATNTGIGVLLWNHPKKMISGPGSDLRVGIVGLGVGTLAAYGRVQDYYRFYEIDPAILRLSEGDQPRFSFLKITAAKVDVVLGDARQSLAREAALGEFQKFDVLVLDAFSSDSIPIHLLTREAMQLYLRHMRGPESVIAFHISNRILDLAPVLRRLSRDFNLDLVIYDSPSGPVSSAATWGMLCRDNKLLHFPKLERRARSNIADAPTIVWTDGFSNLFRLVKKGAWW